MVPPVAASVVVYAVLMIPEGRGEVVVMETVLMANVAARVAVCGVLEESVAWILKVLDPVAVGVPVMAPDALRARPAGSFPELAAQRPRQDVLPPSNNESKPPATS